MAAAKKAPIPEPKPDPPPPPAKASKDPLDRLIISRIKGENFKVLSTLDMRLDDKGTLIPISGPNGAGKSSVIDLVMATLCGKGALPGRPIKKGESAMETQVTLAQRNGKNIDVRLIVTRKAKKDGDQMTHSLKVVTAAGETVKSEQTVLDALVGQLTFDPLAFASLGEKDQVLWLADGIGLTDKLLAIESSMADKEETRKQAGRDRDSAAAWLSSAAEPAEDVPDEEVDFAEVSKAYNEGLQLQQQHQAAINEQERGKRLAEQYRVRIAEIEKTLAEAKDNLAKAEAIEKNGKAAAAKIQAPDLTALQNAIANAEGNNRKVREAAAYRGKAELRILKTEEWNTLDAEIKKLREMPAKLLAEANLGIEGLSIQQSKLYLNDIPLKDCATSEQLLVGFRIGMLLNPKIRCIFVRDASLLTPETLQRLATMAGADGFQVIYEWVDTSGEIGFVLDHGEIVHEPEPVK